MSRQVVSRTPHKYVADGDIIRIEPGVTTYDDGTQSYGMRWGVLHLDEAVAGDRERITQVLTDALNAHEPALALLNKEG